MTMPDDARELPARDNGGLSRFLGGSPLTVVLRLVLLSILVGIVLAAIGLDPWNIVASIRRLFGGSGISASTRSTACGATSCSGR